jgi:hypothetical protein
LEKSFGNIFGETDDSTPTTSNQAPVVNQQIQDSSAKANTFFYDPLSFKTFTDPEGDDMSYSLTTTDGTDVPSWLTFDSQSMSLYGVAPSSAKGDTYNLALDATDTSGNTTADDFTLSVSNSNPNFFDFLSSAVSGFDYAVRQTLSDFWNPSPVVVLPSPIDVVPIVDPMYDDDTPASGDSSSTTTSATTTQSTVASDASQLTGALASTGADSSASTTTVPTEDTSTTPLVAAAQA